jgi:SAM-dependent methyltransferase
MSASAFVPPALANAPPASAVRACGLWRVLGGPSDGSLASRYDATAEVWHARMQRAGYPEAYADLVAYVRDDGGLGGLGPIPQLLDCGIGTGVLAQAVARMVPTLRRLVGIDISAAMLRQAAVNLGRVGLCVDLRRADVRRLPYAAQEFDVVTCAHVLEHLPAPLEALREMTRVLRPGGVLLVVVVRPTPVDAVIRLGWRHVPIRSADLRRWFGDVGIHDVKRYRLGSSWAPAYWLSRAYVGTRAIDAAASPEPSREGT